MKVALLLLGLCAFATCGETDGILVSNDVTKVIFYYYPSATASKVAINFNDTDSLLNSGFKKGTKTIVLIDGFLSTSNAPMDLCLTQSLQVSGYNIIDVDWGALSGGTSGITDFSAPLAILLYPFVLPNVVPVGQRVASFLEFLRVHGEVDQTKVYIIGHSLGVHVAGAAGDYSRTTIGRLIGRITGLDPAGPIYYPNLYPPSMIKPVDASFVDLYHTNAGQMGDSRTGMGQLDVYINGGTCQPGCELLDLESPSVPGYCSHSYSWKFFNASLYRDNLYACPCSDALLGSCFCNPSGSSCGDTPTCPGGIQIGWGADPLMHGNFHATIRDTFQ
jgi:hypothetical protein